MGEFLLCLAVKGGTVGRVNRQFPSLCLARGARTVRNPMEIVITDHRQGHPLALSCPYCGREYDLGALVSKQKQHMTTVHCACGRPFLAVLETRHFARKHLNIKGRYTVMSDSGLGGLVTLRDISEGGVGFTLAAPCDLQPGWLITVFFELSGSERHVVVAKATIQVVNGCEIGCSFINPEQVRQDILSYLAA